MKTGLGGNVGSEKKEKKGRGKGSDRNDRLKGEKMKER